MTAWDWDVVVLGGGASGLFCAQALGHRGVKAVLLEHNNRVGKKILMSGGGRCNFTHLHSTAQNFLSANPNFCRSALARYKPQDFVALVRKHGIAFHEKSPGQLFCDDSAKLIVKLLTDECQAAQVPIRLSCAVASVQRSDDGFLVQTNQGVLRARRVVVATGGLSIPSMGATGFGYDLARQFGHQILPTRAGLVPMTWSGSYQEQFADLSGIAMPIRASVGKTAFDEAMLITHRGLSGPAILQISSYWQAGENELTLRLLSDANAQLQIARQQRGHLSVNDWLCEVFPKRFGQRFAEVYGDAIGAHRRLAELGKVQLQKLTDCLNRWPIQPSGTEGYRTAEVTLGGIDTREVSSASFESQRVPGLHFIGEVLDVTGHLGGHNFQWAWASAFAAAGAIADQIALVR
jgi:predicted Rossmann fold flavoprotein